MISMIAALARNRVIGRDGGLPWRLPRDSRHFMHTTLGKPVIMGRLTFESMGEALSRRDNVVITSDPDFGPPGVRVARSLAEALELTADAPEQVLIGGQRVYEEGLPLADRLYLTFVDAEADGDTHFPELDPAEWREVERSEFAADEKHAHAFSIVTLERR
ncbi:MAG: dihydrofolate reductase [Deltaproteobacteria bacterium]|nr:dihydrofolate reductase [Deltaproteobacteria bacterium]MBW2413902.1 dihydrofolate reductase [Deltaproteobacteria bacterium]